MILIILPINSQEIKKLPKNPPKNIENLTKEEIYNIAYQYYEQCIKLKNELDSAINDIETEIKISEDKDKIIEKYESNLEKYKQLQNKYGFGLNAYAGLNQELRADVFISCDIYFYFLNGHFAIIPGFYIKTYDSIGGGLKFGLSFSF